MSLDYSKKMLEVNQRKLQSARVACSKWREKIEADKLKLKKKAERRLAVKAAKGSAPATSVENTVARLAFYSRLSFLLANYAENNSGYIRNKVAFKVDRETQTVSVLIDGALSELSFRLYYNSTRNCFNCKAKFNGHVVPKLNGRSLFSKTDKKFRLVNLVNMVTNMTDKHVGIMPKAEPAETQLDLPLDAPAADLNAVEALAQIKAICQRLGVAV